ncbi:MAG: S-layer homology domain-containing protein [Ruminococcaceae bacterium]|nr:S-layer homology domain-containing protein [Oscillospiraceae bacterium]
MLKKITAALLAATLFLSASPAFAAEVDERLVLLDSLGIFEGYEDGSYRLENNLTRAEFTKVAVAASPDRKSVSGHLSVSPYSDVPHILWSAPYIQLAARKGYVNGYLDSTFRPDEPITYAEATAVFLRLLGYQNSDFGAAWPQGHMAIAEDLGLCDGISLSYSDAITRSDTVTLLYNLLDQNLKGQTAEYLSVLDCTSQENVIMIATSREDTSVAASKVVTSSGTFKKGAHFSDDWIGRTGELFLENGDTIVAFVPKAQTTRTYTVTDTIGSDLVLDDMIYNWEDTLTVYYKSGATTYGKACTDAKKGNTFTLFYDADGAVEYGLLRKSTPGTTDAMTVKTYAVYSVLSDGIITYKNGVMEKVKLEDGVTLYEGTRATGTLIKATLQMGDILQIVYDEDNDVDYVILNTDGVDGPYTVQNAAWSGQFPTNSSTAIMRDGQKVSASDIETYDILYYSEALNMVLAYSDKITGVYKSASPSKDTPSTVNISGTNYAIEGLEAFNKLATGGAFSYGDTVTLLLGREGSVADVLTSGASADVAGFVQSTGTRLYETSLGESYSGYMLSIVDAGGNTYEFEADKDYDALLNRIVTLSFSDGKVSATLSESAGVSGKVDASAGTLGSDALSPQVKILEVYGPDSYTGGTAGSVFLQRLDGVTIQEKDVLYVARDSQNRISELILSDVTGDLHSYGVVTSAKNISAGMNVSGSYKYMIDGSTGTYQTNGTSYSIGSGAPTRFTYSGGKIYSMTRLSEVTGVVKSINASYIQYADGSRYDITDADIYRKNSDYTYSQLKVSDINTDSHTLTAYYDKEPSAGGKVRIVIATRK